MIETGFEEIVNTYTRLIYTICYRFTLNSFDAENLTQETFLAAYKNLNKLKENPKPYLTVIAANKCKDFLKSAEHRKIVLSDEIETQEEEKIETRTENKEFCLAVTKEIENLKEPYRTVANLKFVKDYSYEEIAKILNKDKKTVTTQVYRARDKLKERLKGWEDE